MSLPKALRLPQITLLVGGQLLSGIGDYFYSIAIMWLAVRIAGSGVGFVAASGGVAIVCFGLIGGVYADRWNRRNTMIVVDVVRTFAVLTLPVLALTGHLQLWQLVVVSFFVNAAGSLFNPSLEASLSPLVKSDASLLRAANALMDAARRLAMAVGPALAGLLAVWLPIVHLFTLDAVSYAISAASIVAIGRRFAWKAENSRARREGIRGVLHQAVHGIDAIYRDANLRIATTSALFTSFSWGLCWIVGVPLLVAQSLGKSATAYGLMVGCYGLGNVLSNVVLGNTRVKRQILSIYLGRSVVGLGYLVLAFAYSLPLALAASALGAVGGPMGDLPTSLMIQRLPADQIGTVFGAFTTFKRVAYSLGLFIAVPTFAILPVHIGIGLGALPLICASLLGVVSTRLWGRARAIS